jgi:ribose transport system permease protein
MSPAKSYQSPSKHPPSEGGTPTEAKRTLGSRFQFLSSSTSLYILLVELGLLTVFSLISPNFFSRTNFTNVAWDTSETLLLALGQTFVVITAGIDLSIGTILMLSGVTASWIMAQLAGTPAEIANGQHPHALLAVLIGIPGGILVGLIAGAVNGILIARLRLPPFIVTLGTFSMTMGLGDLLSSAGAAGQPTIPTVPDLFANSVGNGNLFLGLPTLVIVSGIAAILAHVILKHTIFGRRTFAVGSNFESSRLAGVPVTRQLILVYTFSGFMAGLTAILDLARFHVTDIQGHSLDSLNTIAAVVIGGTSLFGGSGSISGTVIGAFIPVTLSYGFNVVGISSFWQSVAIGAIIIGAVLIDQLRRRGLASVT